MRSGRGVRKLCWVQVGKDERTFLFADCNSSTLRLLSDDQRALVPGEKDAQSVLWGIHGVKKVKGDDERTRIDS